VNRVPCNPVHCLMALALAFSISACGGTNDGNKNHDPIITSLIVSDTEIHIGQQVTLEALISDADGDTLQATWTATSGQFLMTGLDSAIWQAPDIPSADTITLSIEDGKGGEAEESILINVDNQPPVITNLTATPSAVFVSNTITLEVTAHDPDGGELQYLWDSGNEGQFVGARTTATATWIATSSQKDVEISVFVIDPLNVTVVETITVSVSGEVGSVWIADTFNDQVVKMSGDGSLTNRISGFNNPMAVAVYPALQHVWVADFGNNRVQKLDSEGAVLVTVDSLFEPYAIDVWDFEGDAWIAQDTDSSQIIRVDSDGQILARYHGFNSPRAVRADRDGNLWIADTGNNRVIWLDKAAPDGYSVDDIQNYHNIVSGFNRPMALSVDRTTGDCYVADQLNNRVVCIAKGTLLQFEIFGFNEPQALCVNSENKDLWVADTGNNRVVKFIPDLFTTLVTYDIRVDEGFHETVAGYSSPILQPFAISVNRETGNVWYAEEFRLIKANTSMYVVTEVQGFKTPKGVAVNSGR
jgi:DNA-binding beta-propeller fold protein YncE